MPVTRKTIYVCTGKRAQIKNPSEIMLLPYYSLNTERVWENKTNAHFPLTP